MTMKRTTSNIAQDKDEVVHNMAQTLMLLSDAGSRTFECKTCFKKFSSFQALGGHRTSHKKPRLRNGYRLGSVNGSVRKSKVHECSICGLEFPIRQALGGHMRRHRDRLMEKRLMEEKKLDFDFDLNFPPVDGDGDGRLLAFTLGLPAMVNDL